MSATTPFLNLYKPGGGSSGLILPDEVVDIDRINTNMDMIDTFASNTNTSLATLGKMLPKIASDAARTAAFPTPAVGDMCRRTDKLYIEWYNGTSWFPVGLTPYIELTFAAQSCPNSAETKLGGASFAWTEVSDVQTWHDPVTNPTRITPNVAGIYEIRLQAQFAVNGTGSRYIKALLNNVGIPGGLVLTATPGTSGDLSLSTEVYCNGTTDYIELASWQNSGGALNVSASAFIYYKRMRG